VGIGEILALRHKGYDPPLAVRFIGKVIDDDMSGQLNSSGYFQVKGKNNYSEMNMTIEGIGDASERRLKSGAMHGGFIRRPQLQCFRVKALV